MEWFKKDNDVQTSLMQLVSADKIINNASYDALRKEDNGSQTDAVELIMNVGNSGLPLEHLRKFYPVFNTLYKSLRFTITEYPLSQADLFNIHTDTKSLLQLFGSDNTVQKALKSYNSIKVNN